MITNWSNYFAFIWRYKCQKHQRGSVAEHCTFWTNENGLVEADIWIIPGKRRKCYKEGETAKVYWDVIPDADVDTDTDTDTEAGRSIEPFVENK